MTLRITTLSLMILSITILDIMILDASTAFIIMTLNAYAGCPYSE